MNGISKNIKIIILNSNFNFPNNITTSIDKIEKTIIQNNIGLLIIDSLASIVRREFSGNNSLMMHERAIFLSNISSKLKKIAEILQISVS